MLLVELGKTPSKIILLILNDQSIQPMNTFLKTELKYSN